MKKSYQCKYIRCGKTGCKACPHGPYWYAYWREDKKVRCEYIGKVDPRKDASPQESADSELDAIFDKRKASSALAFKILGLPNGVGEQVAKQQYRRLAKERHPDAGGDHRSFTRLNAAWSYLKSLYGWK
jgi:hypothetical protein